jgi:hypothetical protein
MEHLLYGCQNYSTKICDLLGRSITLAIARRTGDYIPNIVHTPLEIVFNKSHPSILLHIKDATTRKVLILLLQETKRDIIFHHAQLQSPRRREELHPRVQAHIISASARYVHYLSIKVCYSTLMQWPSCHILHKLPSMFHHNFIKVCYSTLMHWPSCHMSHKLPSMFHHNFIH